MSQQAKRREKEQRLVAIQRLDQMAGEYSRTTRDFSALFLTASKEPRLVDIPFSAFIDEDRTFQYRTHTGDLSSLAADIQARGQTTPIFVRPHPSEESQYQLISGFRRTAALKLIGADRVRALVFDGLLDSQATELAVSENLHRKDFSDLEKALLCRRLTMMGFSTKQVASLLGKGERTIQEYLSVLSAPPAVHAALEEKRISFSAAIELARDGISQALLTKILTQTMEDALSVHEVRRFLRGTKAKIVDSESAKREWRSSQVAGNGFRPIQIKELGTKGFDLTVKFRPHRMTDHEEILKTCRQIIERIEALRQTPPLTQDQLS